MPSHPEQPSFLRFHIWPWVLTGTAALTTGCLDGARDDKRDTSSAAARDGAVQDEVDTVLAAIGALDEVVARNAAAAIAAPKAAVDGLVDELARVAEAVRTAQAPTAGEIRALSIKAGQLAPRLRVLKRAIGRTAVDGPARAALLAAVTRVELAVRSLNHRAGELAATTIPRDLAGLGERTTERNGPLVPGAPFYVLDEGHVDAVDAALEDGALGITIHDETTVPDVERDPAHVLLVAKPAARWSVPDARFAFLGPVGSNVWLLPEGELEAEALGILWPGLSTEEIEPGTLLDDRLEIRFKHVTGPNGFSLFESPQDEATAPVVLVDSEDDLPDVVVLPPGTHKHANWAFEAAGPYLIKVDVRGRLAEVAGNPWVTSSTAVLKFVVMP